MIFDAANQNKTLADAAGSPKDTSPRLDSANQESKKVTTGKPAENNSVDSGKKRISSSLRSQQRPRPSFEGYMKSSSAHISMDNTGYGNQKNQTARYSERPVQKFLNNKNNITPSLNTGLGSGIIKSGISTNYSRFTKENSSSDRLSKIIRNNNLI